MDGNEAKNQREWRTFLTEQELSVGVGQGATAAIREICSTLGSMPMRNLQSGRSSGRSRREADGAGAWRRNDQAKWPGGFSPGPA